jgi:hypothetical protein
MEAKLTTVIKNYSDLGTYINSILSANGDSPVGGPHAQFWDTLTYNEFISGNVPGVADATTMQPWKILVVGNSAASMWQRCDWKPWHCGIRRNGAKWTLQYVRNKLEKKLSSQISMR